MSIQQIKERIEKVKSLKYTTPGEAKGNSSMAQAAVIFNEVKQKLSEVTNDRTLSAFGMAEKEREIKKEGARQLAKIISVIENVKQKELEEAEQVAKKLATSPEAKPADVDIALFEQKFSELKTELAVFPSRTSAQAMLDFISGIESPYFANKVASEFASFGAQMSAHTDPTRLRTVYDGLKITGSRSEKVAAQDLLKEIEALKGSSAVDEMQINVGVSKLFGEGYQSLVRDYKSFM
ncbi:hypothetical protein BpOF4_04450 [Alkalihalophilus pseudofirmus OF4]|uniref:Uncharacterized protein n=1 Tax=Alkalihalophilus pseudofirmus (strain ATCC BAA-2126 / JCM 17055 / OF4) TaxID=398511 RepID=D3FXW7_ALKPO|nr:hypothetical protein [Alkalihalophilus pseudofirmus]ADC48954.1 hypothetical protein BpOF4_04450 [Alkalihalophilus pseudofirmus OF4]